MIMITHWPPENYTYYLHTGYVCKLDEIITESRTRLKKIPVTTMS